MVTMIIHQVNIFPRQVYEHPLETAEILSQTALWFLQAAMTGHALEQANSNHVISS